MKDQQTYRDEQTDELVTGTEFREFFIDQIRDIYWAEQHLHDALLELEQAATSKKLASAFRKHAKETEWQIRSVEKVFDLLGEEPKAKKCEAMDGIIKEAREIIKDTEQDTYTRDAALILAGQKAEHYEIASYGTLCIFADDMGETEIRQELEKILENEKQTDVILTQIAENYINERAVEE